MFPKGQHSIANVQVQLGIAKRFVDYEFTTLVITKHKWIQGTRPNMIAPYELNMRLTSLHAWGSSPSSHIISSNSGSSSVRLANWRTPTPSNVSKPLFSRRRLGVHAPSTDLRLARLGVQPPHLPRCPTFWMGHWYSHQYSLKEAAGCCAQTLSPQHVQEWACFFSSYG